MTRATFAGGTWTHFGTSVTPLSDTLRRVAGGWAIDLRVHDPRTTCTQCTVNAENLTRID